MMFNNIYIAGLLLFIGYHTLVFIILKRRMSFLKIIFISILIIPIIDVLCLFFIKLVYKEYSALAKIYTLFVANGLSIFLGIIVLVIKLFVAYRITNRKEK